MSAKLGFALFALVVYAGALPAQPAPRPADDKALVTKVYDIKPLLGERGKASGVADADAVIKVIFEAIPQLRDLKPGGDGPRIILRDGGKLEVRAPARVQGEVADLLEAIKRLQDVAVDVKADVYELDAAAYEKLLKPWMKSVNGGHTSPLLGFDSPNGERLTDKVTRVFPGGENKVVRVFPDGEEKPRLADLARLLKGARLVQTSSGRFVNGVEATVSARQSVVTFHNQVVNNKPMDAPQFVKEGFTLVAVPVVSADRRFVRFKLTEQSTALTGMRKRELGEVGGQKIVMQTLDTEDLGATASAVVADGGTMLFRLAYAPKGKVWVVVLRPTIFIQAEENELKK